MTLYLRGQQHEWIVEGGLRDGEKFLARKRLELAAAPRVAETRRVPKFCDFSTDRYAPHAQTHLAARSWKRTRKYQLVNLVRHFGPTRLDELETDQVDSFVRVMLDLGRRTPTINSHLRVLKTMLRWGRESCKLPIPVLKIKLLREPRGRVHCWSSDDVTRVYASARRLPARYAAPFVALLHFLLDTGCRKGEAIEAEWSWVDFSRRLLRIPVTEHWHPKDFEAREVPLSDGLIDTLKAHPRRHARKLFVSALGIPYAHFPEKLWYKVTDMAKVTGGPHTTRHTFASHFLTTTPDLPLLATVLGHSTTAVTELYAHMLPGHLERARNAVQLAPQTLAPTLAVVGGTMTKHGKNAAVRQTR